MDEPERRCRVRSNSGGVAGPALSEASVIETSQLWAEFRAGDGVGPLDLDVTAGESILVLGPSGSGKSTLLRLLHGAVPRAISADVGGTVRIARRDIGETSIAELADVVGVVAQDPESGVCLPDVDDEVAFVLENLGVPAAEIDPAIGVALERAGAESLAGRATDALSGGELQRVALASAIAARPTVLLLDEPTSMLDAEGIDAVREAIDSARRATGAACILVEHRLDELAGDRGVGALPGRWIVVGRDGRIRHDVRATDLPDSVARDLVADGCWLPLDLELRALLGSGDVSSGVRLSDRNSGARAAGGEREPGESEAARDEPSRNDAALDDSALDDAVIARRLLDLDDGAPALGEGVGEWARGVARRGHAVAAASRTLRAQDVTLTRGPKRSPITVLRDLNLELQPGAVVALLGANGAGKSTLLRCLAGLAPPTHGTIEGPRGAMVFQNPEHQFVATTVRAELAHGLRASRATDDRIDAILRRFDLVQLAERSPYRLSGGQKRRVSLAAMLVHDRPHLFADEPTFGLDRRAQIGVMRALADEAVAGRGVCFSSHDLRAVTAYADRVIVLGKGRVIADTTPMALVRDDELLETARLQPPRLLRWLAGRTAGDHAAPRILRALDDLALAASDARDENHDHDQDHDHDAANLTARGERPSPAEVGA